MDRLLVATRSNGKIREIRKLLSDLDYEIVFPDDIGIGYDAAEELIEDADSYAGNATAKARYFAKLSGLPTVADDSGIEVDVLDGRPGVLSRRYASLLLPPSSPGTTQDEANNLKMLAELEMISRADRTARYRCVVSFLVDANADAEIFEGSCEGIILDQVDGDGGFGYDPIFFSSDLATSFGKVAQKEKDRISHRGRAFREFVTWMEKAGS